MNHCSTFVSFSSICLHCFLISYSVKKILCRKIIKADVNSHYILHLHELINDLLNI